MSIGQPLRFHIGRNRLGQYCVPAESLHRPCALSILRGAVWEAETLGAIESHYRGGDIVTAGTYFGDFLPILSRLAAARGNRVLGFEPNRVNYHCAQATCGLNLLSNCTLRHAALGAAPGELSIKTHNDKGQPLGGASRVVDEKPEGESRARFDRIAVTTIDIEAAGAGIGMIQLDTEGHELAALEGARETLARCRPLLVLEAHGKTDFSQAPLVQALARDLGYREVAAHDANHFFAADPA